MPDGDVNKYTFGWGGIVRGGHDGSSIVDILVNDRWEKRKINQLIAVRSDWFL